MKTLEQEKEVLLYYTNTNKFYDFKRIEDLKKFTNTHIKLTDKLEKLFKKEYKSKFIQTCLF